MQVRSQQQILFGGLLSCLVATTTVTTAFTTSVQQHLHLHQIKSSRSSTSTALHAIGALAKKAKQADLRKYIESGISDDVMEKYNVLKEALKKGDIDLKTSTVGPLQEVLTRRKGTITIIAEYKRKNDAVEDGYISSFFDPEILSPAFREYGASGIAVMADERMGGCNYDDIAEFVEEQRRARNEVPGTVPVINNDLIIDELQVARTAALGAAACVITLGVVGEELLETLLKASKAVDIEAIIGVSNKEEAQKAVDIGARLLLVNCLDDPDGKGEIIKDLKVPEGQQVCTITNILARRDREFQEIEDAWALRDKGFNCVWVSDALYKSGNDAVEHPGAIIQAMRSKSSLKFASPKARSGRGEGAREYLGDIMM